MTRLQKIEKIIIGTLLESNSQKNYFDDCRCCITADMFSDEICRFIYGIVSDMNANGMADTDPYTLLENYPEQVLGILPDMLELVVEYSFVHLKMEYNERQFRVSCVFGVNPHYTDVTFTDYVNTFLKLYEDEKRKESVRTAAAAA